jgi:hypothetical protein
MKPAPIGLFTYNRLWHTKKTVESLLQNPGCENSDLYIFSDGPKNENDKQKVNEVRSYLNDIKGFKNINLITRDKNTGLANAIIEGVTQLVNEHERIIVLEDDMITSPFFLKYMNEGLELYQDQDSVACIHAYRYPIGDVEAPFFIRGADCWGWGTWKRAWSHFNPNGIELLNQLQEKKLVSAFNHDNSFPYDKMLKDQIAGKNNSWAVRWKASAFLHNMYTLYYKDSLLINIGNDNSGTHSQKTDQFNVELPTIYENLKLQKVVENAEIAKRISRFYRNTRPGFWQRLKYKLLH